MVKTVNKAAEVEADIKDEEVKEKPYTFRTLNATDIFPMCRIVSKIGVNEFADCFSGDNIKSLLSSTQDGKSDIATATGAYVFFEILSVIMSNISRCEIDIYNLLSDTSNLSVEEIKAMGIGEFAEMVIDFVKKEEFSDFFKAVLKLFR